MHALNFVLRVAWLETVLQFKVGLIESRLLDFSLASLEVIQHGHWNCYRYSNISIKFVIVFLMLKLKGTN